MTIYLFITIWISFQVICIAQAVLHRYIGHKRLIPIIFDSHTKSHHTIYRKKTFESMAYSKEEVSVSHMFIPVGALIAGVAYALLPLLLFITVSLTVIASFLMQVYLHAQFHLSNSWLQRFKWFNKRKEIHRLHHINLSKNFGLINFNCDRIMGTYKPPVIDELSGRQS